MYTILWKGLFTNSSVHTYYDYVLNVRFFLLNRRNRCAKEEYLCIYMNMCIDEHGSQMKISQFLLQAIRVTLTFLRHSIIFFFTFIPRCCCCCCHFLYFSLLLPSYILLTPCTFKFFSFFFRLSQSLYPLKLFFGKRTNIQTYLHIKQSRVDIEIYGGWDVHNCWFNCPRSMWGMECLMPAISLKFFLFISTFSHSHFLTFICSMFSGV